MRLRLVLWAGAITLAIVVTLGVAVYVTVAQLLTNSGRGQLSDRTAALRALIRDPRQRPGDFGSLLRLGFATGGSTSGTYAIVVAPDDTVIGPTNSGGGSLFPGLPVSDAITAARTTGVTYERTDPGRHARPHAHHAGHHVRGPDVRGPGAGRPEPRSTRPSRSS